MAIKLACGSAGDRVPAAANGSDIKRRSKNKYKKKKDDADSQEKKK